MPRKSLIVAALPAAVALLSVSWSALAAAGSQVHQVAQARASLIPAALSPLAGPESATASVPNRPGAASPASATSFPTGHHYAAAPLMGKAPQIGGFPRGVCVLATSAPGNATGYSLSYTVGAGTPVRQPANDSPAMDITAFGIQPASDHLTVWIKVVDLKALNEALPADPGTVLPDNPGIDKWFVSWGDPGTGHFIGARWPIHRDGLPDANRSAAGETVGTAAVAEFFSGQTGINGNKGPYYGAQNAVQSGNIDFDNNVISVSGSYASLGVGRSSTIAGVAAISRQDVTDTAVIEAEATLADSDVLGPVKTFSLNRNC